jgi:hypothetical protein
MSTSLLDVPDVVNTTCTHERFNRPVDRSGVARGFLGQPQWFTSPSMAIQNAYHSLRLAIQGAELMTTGTITLPMTDEHRAYLLAVRTAEFSKDDVIAQLNERDSEDRAQQSAGKSRPHRHQRVARRCPSRVVDR